MDITPDTIAETVERKEFLKAMVMAFRLGEKQVVSTVYHAVPPADVALVCKDMPTKYLDRMLEFSSWAMNKSPRIEFHLTWLNALLRFHTVWLKEQSNKYMSQMRALQKHLISFQDDLSKM